MSTIQQWDIKGCDMWKDIVKHLLQHKASVPVFLSYNMLAFRNPYYVPLFVIVVMRFVPEENGSLARTLKTMCEYDTRQLCPECFLDSPNCDVIAQLFQPYEDSWSNRVNSFFNVHSTTMGIFSKRNTLAVMKRLNRDGTIEQLFLEFCKMRSVSMSHCSWSEAGSVNLAIEYIKNSILEESRIEGCIVCPTSAKRQALQRFLGTIQTTANDLWKVLIIRTNVEPLLLKLMSRQDVFFPAPKLLHSFGFSIIESYDGEPLSNFYQHPLATRVLIARELIKAAVSFTNGINGFRFFLTDINPDNVVVRFGNNLEEVLVSIVDLSNVIIVDSLHDEIFADQNYHVHRKIECDGCFAFVQEDVCRYRNSDLNLFAVCQLLLENLNGHSIGGLLHSLHSEQSNDPTLTKDSTANALHNLLQECVYCRPPYCRNRSHILDDVLNIMNKNVQ